MKSPITKLTRFLIRRKNRTSPQGGLEEKERVLREERKDSVLSGRPDGISNGALKYAFKIRVPYTRGVLNISPALKVLLLKEAEQEHAT